MAPSEKHRPKQTHSGNVLSDGFTLLELLVVVTLIVVLLSLLVPAMDKAIYQAQLATCGARLKGVANVTAVYALENNRFFPYRRSTDYNLGPYYGWPNQLSDQNNGDDRSTLRPLYGTNFELLHDPLVGGDLNLSEGDYNVFADYQLWFGMEYWSVAGGGKSLTKLGDVLEFDTGTMIAGGPSYRFNILASDQDMVLEGATGFTLAANHPDRKRLMFPNQYAVQSSAFLARWEHNADWKRGDIDSNYALTDGAVIRENDVAWDTSELARVPINPYGSSYNLWRLHLTKP